MSVTVNDLYCMMMSNLNRVKNLNIYFDKIFFATCREFQRFLITSKIHQKFQKIMKKYPKTVLNKNFKSTINSSKDLPRISQNILKIFKKNLSNNF